MPSDGPDAGAREPLGPELLRFMHPRDVARLLDQRAEGSRMSNTDLALALGVASEEARASSLSALNGPRRARLAALLAQPAAPSGEAALARERLARWIVRAEASGLIAGPVVPGRAADGDRLLWPRPWPLAGAEASPPAVQAPDAFLAPPAEVMAFWLALAEEVSREGAGPLEDFLDVLDPFSRELAVLCLEDADPVAFGRGAALVRARTLRALSAACERTRRFFQAVGAERDAGAGQLLERLLEASPGLRREDIGSLPPGRPVAADVPRIHPLMEPAGHTRGLLLLNRLARERGLLALEPYCDDPSGKCPLLLSGIRFLTMRNDAETLREILRTKSRTLLRHWNRRSALILEGARAVAAGEGRLLALTRMEALTEDYRELQEYLGRRPGSRRAGRHARGGGCQGPSDLLKGLSGPERDALDAEAEALLARGVDVLARLSDGDFRALLGEIANGELTLSLVNGSDALREKCREHFTERSLAMLREDVSRCGPVRLREVERAQRSVLAAALALARRGAIALPALDG